MNITFSFDLINILIIVTIFVNSFFGFLIYIKGNKEQRGVRAYLFVILAILLWAIAMILYRSTSDNTQSIFFAKILYLAATFTASGFTYFSFLFPRPHLKFGKKAKLFLWGSNIIIALLCVSNGFVVENVIIRDGLEKSIIWGNWYFLYFIYIASIFLWGFLNLRKTYKLSEGIEKIQIRFVFWGYFLAANLAMVTNLIMPSFGNFSLNWLGQILTTTMVLFTVYAILKHRLLNIKVIATELLIFFLWIFILIRLILSRNLEDQIINGVLLIATGIAGFLLIRSVLKEVSARQKIEKLANDLKSANFRLQQLDKQKSEFVSIASHQLRSPLTAIRGYASMVLDGSFGKVSTEINDIVSRIFKSGTDMVNIVQDFLDVTRIELGKMKYVFEKVDIKNLVKEVVENLKADAEKAGLVISIEDDGNESYEIKADYGKIKQIIGNLLDNAIKYTPDGGIHIFLEKETEQVKITISDTGVGIDPELATRLFEKFSRGANAKKRHTDGSGIGLFIVKKIVDAHHGKISACSNKDEKGTSFTIELPVS